MFSSPLHNSPQLPHLYTLYSNKRAHQEKIRELKKRIQATHDVLQLEELKCRKRVLRRLNFTNAADIVDMKGRVACEISSGDELLLTELIFNGVFNSLHPEQCAALLSCFVFTEKVIRQIVFLEPKYVLTDFCRVRNRLASKRSWLRPYGSCKNSRVGLRKYRRNLRSRSRRMNMYPHLRSNSWMLWCIGAVALHLPIS